MKQLNATLIVFALLFSGVQLVGQDTKVRYMDDIFTSSAVQRDVPYATNISVLTGSPAQQNLVMDVYTPNGDSLVNRPVVVFFHTGSFLPQYINGQITGGRQDSSIVEMCRRLNRKGYVAISATYRAGWNPTALGPEGQNTRTGTLLNAAYRGIQDARALIRYLRKSVAEDGNPFGISPDRIALWGQGTGGYISYGAAFLDRFEEIDLDKFIDTETGFIYVDSTLLGDVYGLKAGAINIPNHVNYSSDFALAVNAGGALGDISWIEGKENEPPTIGFHVLTDPFAPFADGPVIVPVTGDFVVNVSGTRSVAETANAVGINTVFEEANNDLTAPINLRNKAYQQVEITTIAGQTITLSADNMYPFVFDALASGPWEWWDTTTLYAFIPIFNSIANTDIDAKKLHSDGLLTNPDMSKAKAMAYIDTMVNYFLPRAYLALDLGTIVNIDNILSADEVDFTVGPNPVNDVIYLRSDLNYPMKNIAVYNMDGRLIRGIMNVKDNYYEVARGNNLPPGMYVLKVEFEQGIVTKKLILK